MKKVFGLIAATLLLSQPVLAQEAQTYNCDYEPSCEVAPGKYGAMTSPVKSKFDLSIGGFVKLDYAYNSTNLGDSGGLLPAGPIPKTSSTAGQKDQSILTARQSRFWLKAAGPNFLGAKTSSLIEADFYGAGGTNEAANLRMRHAYGALDWKNTQVLFGQSSDIFAPMVASTVDFRAGQYTGTPFQPRVPQLRLTQNFSLGDQNSLKLAVAAQNPAQDTNTTGLTAADTWGSAVNVGSQLMFISKSLGVAPGFYGLAMNSLTAGVFGLVGNEQAGGNKSTIDSWGYGAYLFVPVMSSKDGKSRAMSMSFEGQAYLAANMKFNGATGGSLVGKTGDQAGAKGYGVASQLVFYPTQDLGITAGYQRRNAYNYASYKGIDNFEKTNELVYGNVAYDLNAAVRVAVEYEYQRSLYGNVKNNTTAGSPLAGLSDIGQNNTARLALYYFF